MKEIDYRFDQVVVTCDYCGQGMVIYDTTSYREAQDVMRDEGWFSRNIEGEWVDFAVRIVITNIWPKSNKKTNK